MSRVTLSASAALVLLLAACGGSSSSDGPTLDEQIENEIDDNDGRLTGEIITTPDGTRYVVDAIDPNAPGVSSGYLLVARLDSRGNPVVIESAAAIGDAYRRPNTTGTFTYSGNNVSYLSADGAGFQRFEGDSSLSLDFGDDDDNGRLRSRFETGDGETVAVIDAPLDFNPATGSFASDGGTLRYTDDDGSRTRSWGVAGGVNGANAGFSATHGSEEGATSLIGRGVMAGERD
jgi:hypothetical protein